MLSTLAVISAASLWGVDGVLLRPSLYHLPVPLVVLTESAFAALLMSFFAVKSWHELSVLNLKSWLVFGGVALFGGALGTMAITKALFYVHFVNLSIVVLIQKLQPVFALLMAALFLKERLPGRFFIWAGLALVSSYVMIFSWNCPIINTGNANLAAIGFAILAAASFGASTVLSKKGLNNVHFALGTFLRFALTMLIMVVIVSARREWPVLTQITGHQWLVFLIILFTSGGAAIFLYYFGLRNITASVSTICELAFPMTAILLEYFLRGNVLSWVQWLGVAGLLYAIYRVSLLQNTASEDNKTVGEG